MQQLVLVMVGGAFGAALRHVTTVLVVSSTAASAGTATVIVNVTGSLCIGMLAGAALDGPHASVLTPLVAVGVLGGYTTWSAVALESATAIDAGDPFRAICLLVLTSLLGVAAALGGMLLGRVLAL
jgi:CrcB protein